MKERNLEYEHFAWRKSEMVNRVLPLAMAPNTVYSETIMLPLVVLSLTLPGAQGRVHAR